MRKINDVCKRKHFVPVSLFMLGYIITWILKKEKVQDPPLCEHFISYSFIGKTDSLIYDYKIYNLKYDYISRQSTH